jgi:chromate transporter
MDQNVPPTPAITAVIPTKADLFLGFLTLGLLGFGGIAPWARHIIVEQRRWLSERDYAEFIGMGQVLPGSNTINASVLIGQRFHGAIGAALAVAGLMMMPLVVLVLLALLYERFGDMPDVQTALVGARAAAAGMVAGTALKMAWKLKPTAMAITVGAAAFVAAGLLTLPLLPTIAVLLPVSVGLALWKQRR